ncbi:hypothetical protein PFISCL1PPCAC_7547, partial [Pristionchus fissidentatus]
RSLRDMSADQIKERIHLSKMSQVKENEEVQKLEALSREVDELLPLWKSGTETLCNDTSDLLRNLETTSGELESAFRKMQIEIEDELRSIKDRIRDLSQRGEEVHKLQSEVHSHLMQAKIAQIAAVFTWIYNFAARKLANFVS